MSRSTDRTPGADRTAGGDRPRPRGQGAETGSAELQRARHILADGQWHDYEALLRELMRMVPPGRAARAAERHRVGQAARRARYRGDELTGVPAPTRVNDPDRVRDTGARLIVRKVLSDAHFEISPPGRSPNKRIRDRRAAGLD